MLNAVPQSTQNLQQTQSPILTNFGTLDSVFSIDHQAYMTTNAGKHNKVTLPLQNSQPSFLSTEYGLYNFVYTNLNSQELFLNYPGNVSIPITAYDHANTAPLTGGNGWQYQVTGFLQTWGQATTTAGTITITYNSNPGGGISTFPGFKGDGAGNFVGNIAITIIAAESATTNYRLAVSSLTTFNLSTTDGNNMTFMWNATGL